MKICFMDFGFENVQCDKLSFKCWDVVEFIVSCRLNVNVLGVIPVLLGG